MTQSSLFFDSVPSYQLYPAYWEILFCIGKIEQVSFGVPFLHSWQHASTCSPSDLKSSIIIIHSVLAHGFGGLTQEQQEIDVRP